MNIKTEKNGISWLIKKLTTDGWEVERVHKVGYDLRIKRKSETRFVEVKTTDKLKFGTRWLEELEYKALKKYDKKFFLYLISNSNRKFTNKLPALTILNSSDIRKRFKGKSIKYLFDLSNLKSSG